MHEASRATGSRARGQRHRRPEIPQAPNAADQHRDAGRRPWTRNGRREQAHVASWGRIAETPAGELQEVAEVEELDLARSPTEPLGRIGFDTADQFGGRCDAR